MKELKIKLLNAVADVRDGMAYSRVRSIYVFKTNVLFQKSYNT